MILLYDRHGPLTEAQAVRIAAEVKTRRLKISGEELYQYVSLASFLPRRRPDAEAVTGQRGQDDQRASHQLVRSISHLVSLPMFTRYRGKYGPYTPPAALSSVKIFLSREPLPELQPKAPQRTPSPQPPLPPKQGGKLQKPVKTGWFSGVRPRAMEG